jgi:hypothetical protein
MSEKKKGTKPSAPPVAPPPDPASYSKEQQDAIAAANKPWQDKIKDATDREEIEQLAKRICGDAKYVKDGMIFPCKPKAKAVYCVPTHASYPGGKSPLTSKKETIDGANKKAGTNIDWNKIESAEGGKHLYAYVPWIVTFSPTKTGKAADGIGDVYAPNISLDNGRVRGSSNSGVTVGSGVDLGATDADELKGYGVSAALIEKLKPYIGKHRADACKALREKPLTLTDEEAEEMNRFGFSKHAENVKLEYGRASKAYAKTNPGKTLRPWDELSQGEQTALASREYHNGNIVLTRVNGPLVIAVGSNDPDAIRAAYAARSDNKDYGLRYADEMRWMGVDPTPPKKK